MYKLKWRSIFNESFSLEIVRKRMSKLELGSIKSIFFFNRRTVCDFSVALNN